MVISHIQPLLLLACLLPVLHAQHTIDFQYCNGVGYSTFDIRFIELAPDASRPSAINILGVANETLSNLNVMLASKFGKYRTVDKLYNFCKLVSCPILPGSKFILTLPEVPRKDFVEQRFSVIWTTQGLIPATAMCVDFDLPWRS